MRIHAGIHRAGEYQALRAQLEAATDDSQKALIIGLLEAERRHLREILESNVEETS
jgi:rubrerythrin